MFLTACAAPRANTMTVAENENEAQVHAARAQKERAQFDPTELRPASGPAMRIEGMAPEFSYNPTQGHLTTADAELRAAATHLEAAHKLEVFEDAACRDIPPAQRAACPLLASSVTRVQHTDAGFALVMKPGVDVADVHRRLSCHLAWARATGFERPSCPLFVKGLEILRQGDDVIRFDGVSKEVAAELRTQARRVFAGPTLAPVP